MTTLARKVKAFYYFDRYCTEYDLDLSFGSVIEYLIKYTKV